MLAFQSHFSTPDSNTMYTSCHVMQHAYQHLPLLLNHTPDITWTSRSLSGATCCNLQTLALVLPSPPIIAVQDVTGGIE